MPEAFWLPMFAEDEPFEVRSHALVLTIDGTVLHTHPWQGEALILGAPAAVGPQLVQRAPR